MEIHNEFEDLMIRSALGEITKGEQATLRAHLAECGACRTSAVEYLNLTRRDLPLIHEEFVRPTKLDNKNAGERRVQFVKAAEKKGFHFSDSLSGTTTVPEWRMFSVRQWLVVSTLVILATLATSMVMRRFQMRAATASAEVAELERQLVRARTEEARYKAEAEQNGSAEQSALAEAATLRGQVGVLQQRLVGLELQLESGTKSEILLRAAAEGKGRALDDASKKISELELGLAQARVENQSLLDAHRTDEALNSLQQKKLDEVTRELEAKETVVGQTKTMMAADRDIRDLMGARQLHIVDVFDSDVKGKRQRRFGRVFYTEGKSLVFYAFDLNGPGMVEAKESFQAWGTKYGASNQTVKLGMFYMDDKSQRRWALKVDDPDVLREIDSVFVTAEPSRDGKKPTGRRLLFAFLKNPANHP